MSEVLERPNHAFFVGSKLVRKAWVPAFSLQLRPIQRVLAARFSCWKATSSCSSWISMPLTRSSVSRPRVPKMSKSHGQRHIPVPCAPHAPFLA